MSLSLPILRSITSYLGYDSNKVIFLNKQILSQIKNDYFALTNIFKPIKSFELAIKFGNLKWIKHLIYYGYQYHSWYQFCILLVDGCDLEILKWLYHNQKEIWFDFVDIEGLGLCYHDLDITKWSWIVNETPIGTFYEPSYLKNNELEGIKWLYSRDMDDPETVKYKCTTRNESKITIIKYGVYKGLFHLNYEQDIIENSWKRGDTGDLKYVYYSKTGFFPYTLS